MTRPRRPQSASLKSWITSAGRSKRFHKVPEDEALVRKCIAMAMKENAVAMRVCMERLLPIRRDQPVGFQLTSVRTAADVRAAHEKLLVAISKGVLTPAEGQQIALVLEEMRNVIETEELEKRISTLEGNMEAGSDKRS